MGLHNTFRRKHILISLFLSVLTLPLLGQSYMLFEKDRVMNFARLNGLGFDSIYYFMKVNEETVSGEDTTWHFNQQLREPPIADPTCLYKNDDTVMLGNRVLILNDTDRTHVFFNKNNDSIFFKTQVVLGNTWRMYEWSNGSYVKATVINKLEGELLPGIVDSFYRIKLNVFTAGGTLLPDTFPNETKMDFSKTLGLIEFFDFSIFPEPGDGFAHVLRGLSNPDKGIVDVDAQTAFSFEPGYEFHYREIHAPDDESGADLRISAWKYFVMSAAHEPDGATYTMERILFDTLYFEGVPTSNIIWDTLEVHYDFADYAFLDTMEYNLFEQTNFGYADWVLNDTIFNGVAHKHVYDWYFYTTGDSCLSNPAGISNPEQTYGDGLGIIYYLDSLNSDNYYELQMVYFKQGLITYGTPHDFSILDIAIQDLVKLNEFKVYPNPADNTISLSMPLEGNCVYSITDLVGRQLIANTITQTNSIDISALPSGYYIIHVTGVNDNWVSRFIKY